MARMPRLPGVNSPADPNHSKAKNGGARNPDGLKGKTGRAEPLPAKEELVAAATTLGIELPPELLAQRNLPPTRSKEHAPIAPTKPPVQIPSPPPGLVNFSGMKGRKVDISALRKVEQMLREMKSHHVIQDELASEYKVHRTTVEGWIVMVYDHWRRESDKTRPYARDAMREAFKDFYARAIHPDATEKGPDYKAAIQALDRLARIDGAYEPEKVEITNGTPFKTVDTMQERMAELLANPSVVQSLQAMGLVLTPVADGSVPSGEHDDGPGRYPGDVPEDSGETGPGAGGEDLPAPGIFDADPGEASDPVRGTTPGEVLDPEQDPEATPELE